MSFSILGTGSALPSHIVTNDTLSQMMDTSDEWIRTRTGIRERRICTTESITELALQAAQNALTDSGCSADELTLILCATISADYVTPSMACTLQMQLGATCPAFDINAACTGFLYALDVAAGYFARRPNQKILVVAAEAMSRLVDWQDRSTCVLFGDGAGAVVLGQGDDLLALQINAKGSIAPLYAVNGWGNSPFHETQSQSSYLHMDGQEVFRFAVTAMVQAVEQVLVEANITKEQLTWLLPHQANIRILDAAIHRLKLPPETCLTNIAVRGNLSAACVAVLLDEASRAGKIKKGDLLVITAFGGGLTTGACVLRWNRTAQANLTNTIGTTK